MKKIKQKINDIRLQNKLVIIYVVTGLIPLIVLFVFAYCQMRNILMDRDLKSIKGAIEQSVTTVDGQIEVYDNLSNYITFNDTLSGVLSYDYKSTYEMYNQIVTTFDPMLSSLKYFHNDINRVTIYVDKAIKHDTTIAPIEADLFIILLLKALRYSGLLMKTAGHLFQHEKCQRLTS